MLWEVDIYPRPGQPDLIARSVAGEAADLHLADSLKVSAARGYLIQGNLKPDQIENLARRLLADPVVETTVIGAPGDPALAKPPQGASR